MAGVEKKKKRPSRYLIRFWGLYLTVLLIVFLMFFGIAHGWFGYMPGFEELENPESNLASEIYSADGVLLGTYYIENRSNIHFQDLPPHLVNALLATEDIRFYKHAGVDSKALFRVAFGVLTGNYSGGGSTITQQLAKNLFPRGENLTKMQLVMRKFKEWVTATRLEHNYSKEEIIAMYFNTMDYGHQSFGIKSAARTFFNKTPDSLNLEESALLVGVVNGPTWYSPVRNPGHALQRRNLVLSQMEKYGFIDKETLDSVSSIPIDMSRFRVQDHTAGLARYFREYLRVNLHDWCRNHYKADGNPYNLYKDGLKIYTTIDSKMQTYAEEAVAEHLASDLQPAFYEHWKGHRYAPYVFEPEVIQEEIRRLQDQAMRRSERYQRLASRGVEEDSIRIVFNTPVSMEVFTWEGDVDTILTPMDSIRYYKFFLNAGLMAMDPHSGHVRAYVGGIEYRFFKYDHVTQAKRQVGSTFKPFLYTLAMQEGEFSPCYKVANIPYSVELPTGEFWAPRNSSDARVGEMVTLKWALANSNNWISAFLMKRYSPLSVIKIARKMGVVSEIPPVHAIALGSADLSLYEMVGAFNSFANKGVYVEPIFITRIEDKNGNVVEDFIPDKNEAMSEETAYLMLELMKGVVQTGTGIRLRLKYSFQNPIAGKTGTTQNQSDGWFMGITPDLSAGVWVGCEDRGAHFRSISLGQGANMALPIWALFMHKVYADSTLGVGMGDFEKPLKALDLELNCDESEDVEGVLMEFGEEEEF
ncbi:MAG: transglycosylase domain-containing protein [Bacteroidetes bacterium]|nr:transglycosylase domain-containing protein [Bacteroidota bacterium]